MFVNTTALLPPLRQVTLSAASPLMLSIRPIAPAMWMVILSIFCVMLWHSRAHSFAKYYLNNKEYEPFF